MRAIDPRSGTARVLRSGTRPVALAAAGDRVVAADAGGTLVVFDARTRRRHGPPIKLGGLPVAVALAADTAWVADAAPGTVGTRLPGRPPELGQRMHVGARPVAVALAGPDVFVLCRGARSLVRVEAATGRVRERVPVLPDPTAMAVDARAVWVAAGANEVMRIAR